MHYTGMSCLNLPSVTWRGRLRAACFRLTEKLFCCHFDCKCSDNDFPLRWNTQYLSNFTEQWDNAGGFGAAGIPQLHGLQHNQVIIEGKSPPFLILCGVCSMDVYGGPLRAMEETVIPWQLWHRDVSGFWNVSWTEWRIKECIKTRTDARWQHGFLSRKHASGCTHGPNRHM